MGHVHVTHFEAGALSRQAARAKSRYTALVGDFGQRVGLVHELGQLRSTKELFERSGDRLAVDQVVGHQRLLLGLAQTFFHSFFDTGQTSAVLVFGQFANTAHTAVAQVVDVVHFATAIAQVHQNLDNRQNVFVGQDHGTSCLGATQLGIELHTADAR